MSSSIGKINLDLNVNQKQFNNQVNGIAASAKQKFGAMSVAIGGIVAGLVTKLASSIGSFVKSSITAGSDLVELENVVDSVFTTMSDKVDSFSKNALDSFGLTEKQAKKMVGTFGAMSKSFGYSESQAYDMSTALTGLAGDVASFYNLDIDEAYTKLKSVFTGETESLKELGVVMTQTALNQFALNKGYRKTTSQMSEQEKVALRLAFVEDKLAVAQGDVVRTQDSWANQTRKLKGQIDSLKTSLGQGMINILSPVIKKVNELMAKLVQLADAFNKFTERITGKGSSSGSAGAAMKEVAEAATNACDATSGIEDAANGAATAAKKAQKSLMGFDEINRLNAPADTSSSNSSVSDIDFGSVVQAEENKAESSVSKLEQKIDELIKTLKEGFKEGLGDDFEASAVRIKSSIDSIRNSMSDIFNDEGVKAAGGRFEKTVAKTFGNILGSIANIGQTIAELLIGGISQFLDENKDTIKEKLKSIFDAGSRVFGLIGTYYKALSSIFEVFRGDTAKKIISDLFGAISTAVLGALELFEKFAGDFINCVVQPIVENKDKIKEALENTLKPLSEILSTLNTSIKETFDNISKMYDEKLAPLFRDIATGISSIVSTFLDMYNKYLAPVLDSLSKKFSKVWKSHIQPLINKVIKFVGKVENAVKDIWNNVLVPFINWVQKTIIPVIAPILKTIGNTVMNVFGAIADVIGGIIDILGGLIDFIMGVFTGDWSRAWDGIKSIFSGIWDAISGYFRGVWDTLVGKVTLSVDLIKGKIEIVFNAISGFFSSIWTVIKNVFTTAIDGIKSFVTGAFQNMSTVISTVMTTIKNVLSTIWNAIKTATLTVVNGIKTGVTNAFNLMKTAITNVMNGIKLAFSGTWNFIKKIINTILGGIEALVNGVIGGLNKMTRAMNNLSFDIPDWVPGIGGGTFGFNIPEISEVSIPRLAEGGYVKANQPQLVMVGDNKTQGEIVSPEGKMLEVVVAALEKFFGRLKDAGYTQNSNGDSGDIVIPIYLDGTLLDEVIVTAQQRRSLRSGGR